MTSLVLIRHGETEWNVVGRYQGQADPELNERGIQQSKRLAEELSSAGIEILITSPLKRAKQTAEIIAENLNIPIEEEPGFMEIHQGDWQTRLRSEIEELYPSLFARWETEPWDVTPPAGEHLNEVKIRVFKALDKIIDLYRNKKIGIVAHRIPIALIKMRYQKLDRDIVRTLDLPNTYFEEFILDLEDQKIDPRSRLFENLEFLYGGDSAENILKQIEGVVRDYENIDSRKFYKVSEPRDNLSEADVILITYADQFMLGDEPPLAILEKFLTNFLEDTISGIHILPFFPYSSDDGFSVVDYRRVNPKYGTWDHIFDLGKKYDLMFDAVINHVSRESEWFQKFILAESPYTDYFITVDPNADLSTVVRPRALPLLTPIKTIDGVKYLWTTFSDDQIDLNYANPKVLLEIIDLLLYYGIRGARFLRLDAIAYLWKSIGTPSIHLPETHAVIKIFRAALDMVMPGLIFISETNVPHEENISYLGEPIDNAGQTDEAQLVYNFPLAPVILHTFRIANTTKISNWLNEISNPSHFFNFTASHDGVGLIPAHGILNPKETQALVDQTIAHGGDVSYKINPDKSKSVYELNITFYDALNKPDSTPIEIGVKRFLASQAIMLVLAGVPGIYVHSLFGSSNCVSCVQATGRARSINREKFHYKDVEKKLGDQVMRETKVFKGYREMLIARRNHSAFHPRSTQKIVLLHPKIFAIIRSSIKNDEVILCLTNVSAESVKLDVDMQNIIPEEKAKWRDLLNKNIYNVSTDNRLSLKMFPYQSLWLVPCDL